MNVLILGAGASKSYDASVTRQRMPIANDFFKTFRHLEISKNPWVLIGMILNYLKTFHSIEFENFPDFNGDIEVLHSEIQEKLIDALSRSGDAEPDDVVIISAYTQLSFLFASVINEIQNGPVSNAHLNLCSNLKVNDVVITFNWDTLMDRALRESTDWTPESGYFVKPKLIFRNEWNKSTDQESTAPLLLKLHGSTNWLTSYIIAEDGKMNSIQNTDINELYVYESNVEPYACYKGRYMSGYSDYSYGYYPPNLPVDGKPLPEGYLLTRITLTPETMPEPTSVDKGLDSMPLIIPPVKHKDYSYFGTLYNSLWKKSEESLSQADTIFIIGYSFPITDKQTDLLFKKAFVKRHSFPKVVILNPTPDTIVERFIYDYGIPSTHIKVYKEFFTSDFNVDMLFER
ncbi:SIR2 family protein [Pedobacter sp. P351]|uniref:SIR2 family protein n=1 Tax=Pedobacter superstes TaxID=3133441 RepID=UPI00309FD932